MEQTKLMKPLFVNGMFNRSGTRMRAKFIKTVTSGETTYSLWQDAGQPDNNYPKAENDTHYLWIEANGYLIPFGETEYSIARRVACDKLNKEWYGDFAGRNKYLNDNIYKGRTFEEYKPLINALVEKEEEYVKAHENDEAAQAEYITALVEPCIKRHIDARDNNGKKYDFRGAAFLNEIDLCVEIAARLNKEYEAAEAARLEAIKKKREQEEAEKAEKEKQEIEKAENIFANGGEINNAELITKIADKHGIEIPLRTRGWILNSLAVVEITAGKINYRYYKRGKNEKGSQAVWEVFRKIQQAVNVTA